MIGSNPISENNKLCDHSHVNAMREALRDQSLLMRGRGPEEIFIDNEIFHNPSISSLKFSRTPDLLAVFFCGPLCITSDAKRT